MCSLLERAGRLTLDVTATWPRRAVPMPKGNNGIISAQDPDSFRVGADSADGGPSRRTSRQMLCGGPRRPLHLNCALCTSIGKLRARA